MVQCWSTTLPRQRPGIEHYFWGFRLYVGERVQFKVSTVIGVLSRLEVFLF